MALEYYTINKNSGITIEELQLVAFEAAFFIIDKFEYKKDADFFPYWRLIATREIVSVVEKSRRFYGGDASRHFEYIEEMNGARPTEQNSISSYVDEDRLVSDEFLKFIIDQIKEGDRGARILYMQLKGIDMVTIARCCHLSLSNAKRLISLFKNKVKKSFFNK